MGLEDLMSNGSLSFFGITAINALYQDEGILRKVSASLMIWDNGKAKIIKFRIESIYSWYFAIFQ